MAEELFKAKAIDRARLVEMLDPPGKENILVELKAIEKKEAEAAAAHQKMEMEMHQQKKGVSPQQQVK
jgi:cold shock CspA family protein